jgi:hypothetical protein
MAVRRPVYLFADPNGVPVTSNFYEYTDAYMEDILSFASYVHAQDPAVKLECNTANGTQMPNQNFTDTYYIAGASTTRVDRFSTEAETPNISMSTDVYNRIRVIDNQGTLPTSDTNNLEYPLYLTSQSPRQLRAMTRQDFIDTFVTPALPMWGGATANEQGGTYFLSTSATPANATIIGSVPVATNSVANLSAYSSGGIGETPKQTTDIDYWLAKVDYPATEFDPMEASLPLYFDAGTETIKAHTLASWTALLGPFLRYYLGGGDPNVEISYNINGAGTTQGAIFTDSRRTPTGTGYTTRFVNANDYRTQEFPTGTESTVAGTEKRLKIVYGATPVITLSGTSANPNRFIAYGPFGTESIGTNQYTTNASPVGEGNYSWYFAQGDMESWDNNWRLEVKYNGVTVFESGTAGGFDYTTSEKNLLGSVVDPNTGTTYTRGAQRGSSTIGYAGEATTYLSDEVASESYEVAQNTTSWSLINGFKFTAAGNVEKDGNDYDATRIAGGINPGEWSNIIPTGNYWIRVTDDTAATNTGTARSPASGDNYTASGPSQYSWVLNNNNITVTWNGDVIWNKDYYPTSEALATASIFIGDRRYERGNLQTTNNYGVFYQEIGADRYTPTNGTLGSWTSLGTDQTINWSSTDAEGSYGSRFTQIKVEIADDAAGSNIVATGYYKVNWHGQQLILVNLDGALTATANSNGLSGSCSARLDWNATTVAPSALGNPGSSSASYDWIENSGTASDYEVRFTYSTTMTGGGSVSGTVNGVSGVPASGTWYPAENTHAIRVSDSGTDPDSSFASGSVSIRDQASGTILATRAFSITANNDP